MMPEASQVAQVGRDDLAGNDALGSDRTTLDAKYAHLGVAAVLPPEELQRLRALADALDCLTEQDLLLLADITPPTAEGWRKRGKGPAYVLIGKRYLYPRKAVAEFVNSNLRERNTVPAKAIL